jgi:hypothetical protein
VNCTIVEAPDEYRDILEFPHSKFDGLPDESVDQAVIDSLQSEQENLWDLSQCCLVNSDGYTTPIS